MIEISSCFLFYSEPSQTVLTIKLFLFYDTDGVKSLNIDMKVENFTKNYNWWLVGCLRFPDIKSYDFKELNILSIHQPSKKMKNLCLETFGHGDL